MRLREKYVAGAGNRAGRFSEAAIFFIAFAFFQCNGAGNLDINLQNPRFPSSASAGPSGNDALSASTNFSSKVADRSQKADPLAAAAFIAPPKINNTGAVSFSYPLEIPPGRGGQNPQISLAYSSSGGDGWLGMGWSLGLGSISRTTNYGPLYYDKRDTFVFGGKRLVRISGAVNSEDGIYRPEIEDGSFQRLELTDSAAGGVWKVWDGSGGFTVYGETMNARFYVPGSVNKTYTWNFSRSVDRNDNSVEAVYDDSNYAQTRMLYLKEIKYSGNASQNFAAKQYVRLERGSRSDSYVSKAAGFIMKMDQILTRIVIGQRIDGDDEDLWHYDLDYTTSSESGRPLLVSISGNRTSTKPVFHYHQDSHTLGWQKVNNVFRSDAEGNPQDTKYLEGDFNGDGISDMAFFNYKSGDWKVVTSQFNGSRTFATWGNRFGGYTPDTQIVFFRDNVTGDYDGNGKSDIAFYLPEVKEFWVAESQGYYFTFKMYGKFVLTAFDLFKSEWFSGDFDGNGITDILLFDESTGSFLWMENTGGAFRFTKIAENFRYLFRSDYSPGVGQNGASTRDHSDAGEARGKVHWLSGDYNGDGRSDLSFYDERSGKWWVGENLVNPTATGSTPVFTINWRLYQVFQAPARALFAHERFSGDFNGDGYTDFMIFDREKREFLLGEVGFTSQGLANNNDTPVVNFKRWSTLPSQVGEISRWLQGDFNGDGRTDAGFYSRTDNNFWIAEATATGMRYRIYNNISFGGPDPDAVMKTPQPEDEVVVQKKNLWVVKNGQTLRLEVEFDGNEKSDRGERLWAGCFLDADGNNCATATELLIYNEENKKFYLKVGTAAPVETGVTLDLAVSTTQLLSEKTVTGFGEETSGHDQLLWRQEDVNAWTIRILQRKNGALTIQTLATIAKDHTGAVKNFSPTAGVVNSCRAGNQQRLLFLNDQPDAGTLTNQPANFVLVDGSGSQPITIEKSPANLNLEFKNIFFDNSQPNESGSNSNRAKRSQVAFFCADLLGLGQQQVLVADQRGASVIWYVGIFGSGKITFYQPSLPANVPMELPLVSDGGRNFQAPTLNQGLPLNGISGETLVYGQKSESGTTLSRFTLVETATGFYALGKVAVANLPVTTTMDYDFDHDRRLLLDADGGEQKLVATSTGSSISAVDFSQTAWQKQKIDRPDLYTKLYPYDWIQGDYNGDGKTDLGIFRLKDQYWYFAVSQGSFPDLVSEVENGIGGVYRFSYANSSSFDNTGVDNIPDLAVNYKVATSLTVEDGAGGSVTNTYRYQDGYAWSSFVSTNGKLRKETDYFGFSRFIAQDAEGGQTIEDYHNVPFANYLHNRALNGALKTRTFLGRDGLEYSRTEMSYEIIEFNTSLSEGKSYLVFQKQQKEFRRGVAFTTLDNVADYDRANYRIQSSTQTMTDHYSDSAHAQTSTTGRKEFAYVEATNEHRLAAGIERQGSAWEVSQYPVYDGRGNVIETSVVYTGSGLDAVPSRITRMEVDGFGNVLAKEDASASPTRRSEFTYDSSLQQFVVEEKLIADAITISRSLSIDYGTAFGQPTQMTDANGNLTWFTYDSYGRLVKIEAEAPTTAFSSAKSRQTLADYSYTESFPFRAKTIQYSGTTDPDFVTTVYKDGFGRDLHQVTSASGPNGEAAVKSGRIEYDALGRVKAQSQPKFVSADEFDEYLPAEIKNPTRTEYDGSGRVKKLIAPAASAAEAETSVTTIYNDPFEVVTTHSQGQGKKTTTNARGHLLYVEDFGPGTAGGEIRAKMGFCYGLGGQRLKRSDLNGASMVCPSETAPSTIPVVPDTSGNNVSFWRYDGFGQLKQNTDPDSGVMTMSYTAFGEVSAKTDSRSITTTYTYDRLGRMISKNPGLEGLVTYTYDQMAGSEQAIGRLVALEDSAQKKTFSYDALGRKVEETRWLKSVSGGNLEAPFVTGFAFDLLDRSTVVRYPMDPTTGGAAQVCYHYNAFGKVASVDANLSAANSCSDKVIISSIVYNEFMQIDSVTRGNNLRTLYDYDNKRRIVKLTEQDGTTTLTETAYQYNLQDSLISKDTTPTGAGSAYQTYGTDLDYSYDGLNRLIEAQGKSFTAQLGSGHMEQQFRHSYAYALNGNISSKTKRNFTTGAVEDNWTYSYTNHKVTSITTSKSGNRFQLTYDEAGNMSRRIDNSPEAKAHQLGSTPSSIDQLQEYDAYQRVKKVWDNATATVKGEYYYDDQGFRVRKISRETVANEFGGQEEHLYELQTMNMYFAMEKQKDPVTGQEIVDTTYALNNIYLDGVRIAAMLPNGSARYFMTDQVDSVNVVTNDSGEAVNRTEFLPYGETWFVEGEKSYAPKFNSQELDKESDLYYFNARHYDPEIARFVSADSVIDGEDSVFGWNRYMYVHGNPILYKDPTGHDAWEGKYVSSAEVAESQAAGQEVLVPVVDEKGEIKGFFDFAQHSQNNKANDTVSTHDFGKGESGILVEGHNAPMRIDVQEGQKDEDNPRRIMQVRPIDDLPSGKFARDASYPIEWFSLKGREDLKEKGGSPPVNKVDESGVLHSGDRRKTDKLIGSATEESKVLVLKQNPNREANKEGELPDAHTFSDPQDLIGKNINDILAPERSRVNSSEND